MFHCKWKMTELKKNIQTEMSNSINFHVWIIKDIVNKKNLIQKCYRNSSIKN